MIENWTGLDVIDTDHHFIINGFDRTIKSKNPQKDILIQNDHNSERFTFEIPRYIEGYDIGNTSMVIQVYFSNGRSTGVYTVNDADIYPFINDVVTCSWLISQNATRNVGTLEFMLRIAQIDEDATVKYAWSTQKYSNVRVVESIDAAENFEREYVDVIQQWKNDVEAELSNYVEETVATQVDVAQIDLNRRNISAINSEQSRLNSEIVSLSSIQEGSTVTDVENEVEAAHNGFGGHTYNNLADAITKQINSSIPGINRALASVSYITENFFVQCDDGGYGERNDYSTVMIPVRGGEKYYISNNDNVHVTFFNNPNYSREKCKEYHIGGYNIVSITPNPNMPYQINGPYVTVPDNAHLMTVSVKNEYFGDLEIYTRLTSDAIFDGEIGIEKLSNDLRLGIKNIKKTVTVGENGNYTSILRALIENGENTKVYVQSGAYDIYQEYIDEYGEDYFDYYSGYPGIDGYSGINGYLDAGLFLSDGCELIGVGEVNLKFDYHGDNSVVNRYFSLLNTSQNNVVDNINFKITDGSGRYIIHDDFATKAGINIFRNCTLDGTSHPEFRTSMGCGMGVANTYVIENCHFKNNTGLDIAYHNNKSSGKNKLIIKDCHGSGAIRGAHYGTSTEKSEMYVSGCKAHRVYVVFGKQDVYPNENIELIAWNNETEV